MLGRLHPVCPLYYASHYPSFLRPKATNPPFSQAKDAHPRSEAWLLVKLLVYVSAVGARHVVPLLPTPPRCSNIY